MNTLFLAWQHAATRRWFPVGRLTMEGANFRFVYVNGVKEARNDAGFCPFPEFPEWTRTYEANELFPLFSNRVMPASRPDFAETARWLLLESSTKDPLAFLAQTNGHRQTDSLEVFPAAIPTPEGGHRTTFFLRGLRHLPPEATLRAQALGPGERLLALWDAQNPQDRHAVALRTHTQPTDHATLLGFCPRYLAPSILDALRNAPDSVRITVRAINPQDVPIQYRVWCELYLGPDVREPFTEEAFLPVSDAAATAGLGTGRREP